MEYSRILWVSQKTKNLWQPRIQAVSDAFVRAEVESVYKGKRRATIQTDRWWRGPVGFVTLGIDTVRPYDFYAAGAEPPKEGEPFSVRTVTLNRADLKYFLDAWYASDNDTIGVMLGYPMCCIHFFDMTWLKGMIDPTAAMPDYGPIANPYANPLLRVLGIRPVPHMPCRFDCPHSIEQGKQFMSLMPDAERAWALELLSMPMEYSTLHGAAEVSTPLFKLGYSSQGERTFRFEGETPDGAVGGSKFPFTVDDWTLNGFIGPASMKRAHNTVLECVPPTKFAVDFGCGNGTLLSKMYAEVKLGIDNNREAIRQGLALNGKELNIIWGDMNNLIVPPHTLSIISMERLVESPNPGALIQKLASEAVVYSYSDGLELFEERQKTYFGDWKVSELVSNPHAKVVRLYHGTN